MKKLLFILSGIASIIIFLGIQSCDKEDACYQCQLDNLGQLLEEDICNGEVTYYVAGVKTVTTKIPNGQTNEEYKNSLEDNGYECIED